MSRWVPIVGLLVAVAAVPAADRSSYVAVAGGTAGWDREPIRADDPFPIRRVAKPRVP